MGKLVIGTVFDLEDKAAVVEKVKSCLSFGFKVDSITFEDLEDRLHFSNHLHPGKGFDVEAEDAVDKYLKRVEKEITFQDCIEFLRMFGLEFIESYWPVSEAFRDDYNETFVSFKE